MVMLNATPGKSGYTVTYSTTEDRAEWGDYSSAVNIVYGQLPDGSWEGLILNVTLAPSTETGCNYTNGTISRLCADLWYLDKLDDPGRFVEELKSFTLPATDHPKNYARPGIDIMAMENPPWEDD